MSPDETTTMAAIDCCGHHSSALKMNAESYWRRDALDRSKRKHGHPAGHATEKNVKD